MNKDHVRVRFERSRLAQVGELRSVIGTRLRRARKLRQHHQRRVQLLRQSFQLARIE